MKALGLLDNVEREGQPSLHSSYTKCINKDLRYLKDLLNFSKLLVFILLCATSQAKVSTLYDTLNFKLERNGLNLIWTKLLRIILQRISLKGIMAKLFHLTQKRQLHMSRRGHESFKVFNLHISDVMTKIKVLRKRWVAKNRWCGESFNYDNFVKTWNLWTQRLIPYHKSS